MVAGDLKRQTKTRMGRTTNRMSYIYSTSVDAVFRAGYADAEHMVKDRLQLPTDHRYWTLPAILTHKAMIAMCYSDEPSMVDTTGGAIVRKPPARSRIERDRLDVLLDALADLPGIPFGDNPDAVELVLRRHLYNTSTEIAAWATGAYSRAHRMKDWTEGRYSL